MVKILSKAPQPFTGTEVHVLPNGMTAILKRDSTIPVVALQVWARCGAVDEEARVYGISHGLEHMVFKGTPTRNAAEITRDIEGHGGSINAATQLETTHYYIDIPSYGFDTAFDVIADAIMNPAFPADELTRERKVILEEIHRRDDSPEATLWDEFASTMFRGTAYGTKVIGSIDTVSAMTSQDLHEYFSKHYVPSNLAVVVVGDFNRDRVLNRIRATFGLMKRRSAPAKPHIALKRRPPFRKTFKKPVQMTYFAAGQTAPGMGHPDSVMLDLLADVLAGGASSRLYQKLREEQQLVMSLACDYIPFSQHGMFAFFGDALPGKADAALKSVFHEMKRLREDPIQEAELSRARARIKSEWLHGSETSHGQASTLGTLFAIRSLSLIDTYLKRIDAATPADLMAVAKKYVNTSAFNITKIVPEKKRS